MLFDISSSGLAVIGNEIYHWGKIMWRNTVSKGERWKYKPHKNTTHFYVDDIKCGKWDNIALSEERVYRIEFDVYGNFMFKEIHQLKNITSIYSGLLYFIAVSSTNNIYIWGKNLFDSGYNEHSIELNCGKIHDITCCETRAIISTDNGVWILGKYGPESNFSPERIIFASSSTIDQIKCNDKMIVLVVGNKIYINCNNTGKKFSDTEFDFMNLKIFSGFDNDAIYITSNNELYRLICNSNTLSLSKVNIDIDDIITSVHFYGNNIFIICRNEVYCKGSNDFGILGTGSNSDVPNFTLHELFTQIKSSFSAKNKIKSARFF